MQVPVSRPVSAVHPATGLLGMAGLILALIAVIHLKIDPKPATLLVLVLSGLPMLAFEIWQIRSRSTPFLSTLKSAATTDWPRILVKGLGFAVAWGALGLWFDYVPIYGRPEYFYVLTRLDMAFPFMLILGAAYVIWCDRRMAQPHDGAWHTGQALIDALNRLRGNPPENRKHLPAIELPAIRDFLLGWFIKGFFLVFLVSILPNNIEVLSKFPVAPFDALGKFVFWSTNLLFTIDIVLACVGYACTFKPLDSHIRSVNPTVLGWVAALACYPPFGIIGVGNLIDYQSGGTYWDLWLSSAPDLLMWSWGIALVFCLVIYTWATVAFGIRFSNLTDRGILTHGPYRLVRHPAYLAKNSYWWLVSVPWINQMGTMTAIKCCLMLAVVNMIYFLRAWTEEQHLGLDPTYTQYKQWSQSMPWWKRIVSR